VGRALQGGPARSWAAAGGLGRGGMWARGHAGLRAPSGPGEGAPDGPAGGKGRGPALCWETKLGREQAEREWVLISILFIYLFSFSLFFISILSDLISSSSTNS
jgi:hypothetical protein